jgi:hypothetical protein
MSGGQSCYKIDWHRCLQVQEVILKEAAAQEREKLVGFAPFLTGRFQLLENLKVYC